MMNMSENKMNLNQSAWQIIGLIILPIRFVQGFIYWGGGSRRFIYDPAKLDPHAPEWMANKLQSAMPGALLGTGHAVSFLLQHFILLYVAIILFSLFELIFGFTLMIGFFTRLSGFITVLLSISLMLLFGWQGSTCVDEWTMAVATLAIGLVLTVSGGLSYSVDSFLVHRNPQLLNKRWFTTFASGPWALNTLKKTAVLFTLFAIAFTLITYNYYRGAIFSAYHSGPVSPVEHHVTLTEGYFETNGAIRFNLYIDAGSPAAAAHIIRIALMDSQGTLVESWQAKELSKLTPEQIVNTYAYNRVTTGPFGLVAPVSAKATIHLPGKITLDPAKNYQIDIITVSGHQFKLMLINKNGTQSLP